MPDCPLCEEQCEGWQALAEHVVRWHQTREVDWNPIPGPRARRRYAGTLRVHRKAHKVRCWCGEVFSLLTGRDDTLFTDVGLSDFARHLLGVEDVAKHILEHALGVAEEEHDA